MTLGDWLAIGGGVLLLAFVVVGFRKATAVKPGEKADNEWIVPPQDHSHPGGDTGS